MAFCSKCGTQVPDGTPVCPNCGTALTVAAAPYPTAVPQAAPVNNFDHTAEFDARDISDNKVMAMAPYLLGVLGIVIALLASQESKFTYFHVRQAMKIQLTTVLVAICAIVPVLGWIFAGVCSAIIFVLQIICFFNVAGGKAKEVPIIRGLPFFK